MSGRTVSHYRIIEKLGQGGMGIVYRAEDTKLGRLVALKFLPESSLVGGEERTRFMHEARAAASLNHPNICTIHEIDEHEGRPFIVMEFVEGRSLASFVSEGPLKVREAMAMAMQIAEGLNEAHERGIVHRDVKPANIMVDGGPRIKIMDFGLAAVADQTRLTREGTTLGTVAYMSPEQARGEQVDRRSDIWSLGAVLYEMITGRRPFRGEYDQAVIYGILNEDPEPPTALRTGVPLELERIVLKALAKRVDERYQHSDELLGDLRRLERSMATGEDVARKAIVSNAEPAGVGGDTSPAGRPLSGTARAGRSKRRRWIAAGICVVAAAVAGYMILKPLVFERQLVASPKPIAVISFENMTGDSSYDYLSKAIPNLLITSLEQSKYLRVTTWERMRDLLEQLGKNEVDAIDKELGFELCRLDGIDVIVTGSFVKAGNTFATDIKVLDVRTKELLKSASTRGEGVESILRRQVDELSREIAQGIGLSSRRIDETQRPVAEVTTGSMEAYNYYLRGANEYEKFYYDDARRFLEKAVEMDSTFAMAYAYLASTYGAMRNIEARKETYDKAMRYAERATERERLYIEARYALTVERDNQKYVRLLQEIVRKYPKEKVARYSLGIEFDAQDRQDDAIDCYRNVLSLDPGNAPALNMIAYAYIKTGNYERALEYLERYASASPGDANPFDSMAELYFCMGDLARSIARYREAIEVKPDFYGSMKGAAFVYAANGDLDSALVWIDRYLEAVPTEGLRLFGYGYRSLLFFLEGRTKEAFADIERWEEREAGGRYPTAAQKYYKGQYLLLMGRYAEAERAFEEWREIQNRLAPQDSLRAEAWSTLSLALVHARSGRTDDAMREMARVRRLMSDPALQSPISSFVQYTCILVSGETLLGAKRYDEAIAIMRDSLDLEIPIMGNDAQLTVHNFPLDLDVAARAYAAKGELERAAEEYRRLIEFDPRSRNRRMRYPMYHYRLAKIYEKMGRPVPAAEQYERFLRYWHKADRDLPEYVDARRRLEEIGQ